MSGDERPLVLLYNPRAVFHTMPLGLIAIGSALDRERYDVRLIDGRFEADPVAAIKPLLDRAVCLGVTVLTGRPIADALEVSRAAKEIRPDLPVVWGGWHPSLFPTECLADPSVDVTVLAQGEATFEELVERFAKNEAAQGVLGTAHRGSSLDLLPIVEPPRPLASADSFPAHDYGLIDVERYFAAKGQRQLDYITSYGCYFRCAFCADPFVYNRKWTGLPPERIVDELSTLWKVHRFDDVNFQDETFFTYQDRIEELADRLISMGNQFSWAGTLRADQATRMPESVLAKCVESGLRRVLIGVESGSQEMLDWMKKDITLEQVFETAERCRRLGIAVQFPFIVGFPNESEASVRASLDMVKKLRSMSPRFETPIFYFKPYPGSAITDQAVRDGYELPASLEAWSDFEIHDHAGPWVDAKTHDRVERFKYYQALAWDEAPWWKWPFAALARWRCLNDEYRLALELWVSQRWRKRPALS